VLNTIVGVLSRHVRPPPFVYRLAINVLRYVTEQPENTVGGFEIEAWQWGSGTDTSETSRGMGGRRMKTGRHSTAEFMIKPEMGQELPLEAVEPSCCIPKLWPVEWIHAQNMNIHRKQKIQRRGEGWGNETYPSHVPE
jgi:hypothetical protein